MSYYTDIPPAIRALIEERAQNLIDCGLSTEEAVKDSLDLYFEAVKEVKKWLKE